MVDLLGMKSNWFSISRVSNLNLHLIIFSHNFMVWLMSLIPYNFHSFIYPSYNLNITLKRFVNQLTSFVPKLFHTSMGILLGPTIYHYIFINTCTISCSWILISSYPICRTGRHLYFVKKFVKVLFPLFLNILILYQNITFSILRYIPFGLVLASLSSLSIFLSPSLVSKDWYNCSHLNFVMVFLTSFLCTSNLHYFCMSVMLYNSLF